jgi:hypothetical protein
MHQICDHGFGISWPESSASIRVAPVPQPAHHSMSSTMSILGLNSNAETFL